MLFLMLLGLVSFGQTATLATVTASPGQNVPVALNVTGFTGIGSITFYIQFDPTVMTLTGITVPTGSPWLTQGSFWNVVGNQITMVGVWGSNATFPPGKMLDLNFTYHGMTTGSLNFLGNSEVTQGLTVLYPLYTNGSVSMATVATEARLVSATAVPTGGNISIPLEYKNFTGNVSAITQKIHYDPTKLNFVSVTGIANLANGTNYDVNTGTGIINITWTNAGGQNINSNVAPFSKFILNFVYIGSTSTTVNFVGGSLISSSAPVTNIAVTYYNGTISPGFPTATAKLGSIINAQQGLDYEVPLTLWGFPSGTAGGTQSFTLTIPFNSPRLSYLGLSSPVPAGLVVSQAEGALTLAWTNSSGPDINGVFVKLNFKYNGIGMANVTFGNGCVFNTYNAGTVGTVQVDYTNSTIAPAIASANAIIGRIQGLSAGSEVNVPINFTGLPDMGAVTLFITYDNSKLTFIDVQNNIFGATVDDPSANVIAIAWNSLSSININTKFLDLHFIYNGGGGNCESVAITFTDACQLANWGSAIVPTNYINGGINLLKISGTLKYNSDPLTRLPLKGFTVNLKTNPGMTIVASATTTPTGYYELWAANGNYKLDALPPAIYLWYADFDDVLALFDYTFGTPLPEENALRLTAGDVTQSGSIDFDDVLAVFDRTFGNYNPNYTAPDWIFEQPPLTITCSNLPNQDFMGINSGNVRGTNPTPTP